LSSENSNKEGDAIIKKKIWDKILKNFRLFFMESKKLLILHGWGSSSKRWQKVKEILKKSKIEVIIPDLPGFGEEPPPDEPWGVKDYKEWILNLARKKGWKKFNLFGHSFGGGLAVKVAAETPERIGRLILCSPAIIREKNKKTLAIEKTARVGKKIIQKIGREEITQFFAKVFYRLIGSLDYYRANGVMKETIKRIFSEDLSPNLRRLKQPVLILWGKRDYSVPIKYALRIQKEICQGDNNCLSRRVKLVVFPKGGHALNIQIPNKIAEEVIKFLKN